MKFNFKKKSKYSRQEVWKEATGRDEKPDFSIDRTGYGRIDNNLFIFMNIDITGNFFPGKNTNYENHYDEKTQSVKWCAKRDTHSKQPLMQKIINGELDLYLFARWKEKDKYQFLGEAYVVDYKDNFQIINHANEKSICMQYDLICKEIEEDINQIDFKSSNLIHSGEMPRKKSRRKSKKSFNPRKPTDYLFKAQSDKKIGEAGEAIVFNFEKKRLLKEGFRELSEKVEHVSVTQGDGLGYDILSYDSSGEKIYIEVKTTKLNIDTDFYMTPNEIEFSKQKSSNYILYRLYDLKTNPNQAFYYTVKGKILHDYFQATPTEFRMSR